MDDNSRDAVRPSGGAPTPNNSVADRRDLTQHSGGTNSASAPIDSVDDEESQESANHPENQRTTPTTLAIVKDRFSILERGDNSVVEFLFGLTNRVRSYCKLCGNLILLINIFLGTTVASFGRGLRHCCYRFGIQR